MKETFNQYIKRKVISGVTIPSVKEFIVTGLDFIEGKRIRIIYKTYKETFSCTVPHITVWAKIEDGTKVKIR